MSSEKTKEADEERYANANLQGETSSPAAPPSYLESLSDRGSTSSSSHGQLTSHLATNAQWSPSQQDLALACLSSQGFSDRVKQRFARSHDPFSTPAPSFTRAPPPSVQGNRPSYTPFEAFVCVSKGKGQYAAEGFEAWYPGKIMVDHDISSADWNCFLEDIEISGKYSGAGKAALQVLPITNHLHIIPFLGLASNLIQKGLKGRKEPAVLLAVEHWQKEFFAKRGVDVFLLQGNERLTARGPGEPIPGLTANALGQHMVTGFDNHQQPLRRQLSTSSQSSTSSDSGKGKASKHASSHSNGYPSPPTNGQAVASTSAAPLVISAASYSGSDRHQRRMERREDRHERRMERREQRGSARASRRVRLVVAPL